MIMILNYSFSKHQYTGIGKRLIIFVPQNLVTSVTVLIYCYWIIIYIDLFDMILFNNEISLMSKG